MQMETIMEDEASMTVGPATADLIHTADLI